MRKKISRADPTHPRAQTLEGQCLDPAVLLPVRHEAREGSESSIADARGRDRIPRSTIADDAHEAESAHRELMRVQVHPRTERIRRAVHVVASGRAIPTTAAHVVLV